ncbi:MAG: sulfur carrier protein ThiS [Lachnospiraceae bacterium]|nr:sulfur carrier protein ThiS [Lachnospiraceae bacterium]
MTIEVNGRSEQFSEEISLSGFVKAKGYDLTKIAVELNGAIIPKSQYACCVLKEQDTLEIVTFVGGG